MIADHYILVQRWRPFFTVTSSQTRKVAAWIRIPRLPIELYNDRFLWRVGNKPGSMLKIDKLTSIHSRGKLARICVEINLNRKLISMINVMGHIIKLEYEGLHAICFNCGRYGHKQDQCVPLIAQAPNPIADRGKQTLGVMEVDDGEQNIASPVMTNKETQSKVEVVTNITEENIPYPNSEAMYGPWMIVKRGKKIGQVS
uniref:CCHC-type domain-containing protein n=1 Tax=Cajanus cajan TaxID=3821 RepID=A0A151RVD8_CAJCA|nr:hypothetical protein KK1_031907 [Cajanus cajan]